MMQGKTSIGSARQSARHRSPADALRKTRPGESGSGPFHGRWRQSHEAHEKGHAAAQRAPALPFAPVPSASQPGRWSQSASTARTTARRSTRRSTRSTGALPTTQVSRGTSSTCNATRSPVPCVRGGGVRWIQNSTTDSIPCCRPMAGAIDMRAEEGGLDTPRKGGSGCRWPSSRRVQCPVRAGSSGPEGPTRCASPERDPTCWSLRRHGRRPRRCRADPHGARVLILDKGLSVGGRLASRRMGAATFDLAPVHHRSKLLGCCRHRGVPKAGVVADGVAVFRRARGRACPLAGHPTMTSVVEHLARASRSSWKGRLWRCDVRGAMDRSDPTGEVSPPSRRADATRTPARWRIMEAGGLTIERRLGARLEGIELRTLPRGDAVLSSPSRRAPPGGLRRSTADRRIADNH